MRPGVIVRLFDRAGGDSGVRLRLVERTGEQGEAWIVAVEGSHQVGTDLLGSIGLTPLPPYILAARRRTHQELSDERDRETYQTVYATDRGERPDFGSVAAPTAGLHFTPELLAGLRAAGVERAEVTLDVGMGTFKPVETEFVEQHAMHSEWCGVPEETARAIQRTRSVSDSPGRVIAVGTTAARTLESFDSAEEMLRNGTMETRLLITPGYRFKHVDALLTNFHLPRSTLMAMVGAFLAPPDQHAAGVDRLKGIYETAVRERYRFYSYGDAMLIVP